MGFTSFSFAIGEYECRSGSDTWIREEYEDEDREEEGSVGDDG